MMADAIVRGRAVPGIQGTHGEPKYYVPVRGRARLVAWSPRHQKLITALPCPDVEWSRVRELLADMAEQEG